ncbi:hypothetical protein LTSERUB_4302 [Salmonella enterica subsp. enterica serovar Rubislaw str. A4-653]|uniref:Uncharacterized protein n=1 Tax=Salmonella enterica subsp. enterica serovar Rubislaw str. A4-653 TaxID=913081 RepID=G5QN14_SALRU|nr:hypothetical protein LTSERUB_4302 [Salmonella enterica subsp. enterica serovar Rubislaw str. A4-653]
MKMNVTETVKQACGHWPGRTFSLRWAATGRTFSLRWV